MNQITTVSKKFTCGECDNELTASDGLSVGDYFECDYCGIEYEVLSEEGGELSVKVSEEEK